ncbi:hypothetical protein PAPYR_196 [Paratrimastix pyriformis]|uniref:Uncharacterized protein n=1 Tax=Paratrimastix pyriformis TaxID=342808 RepID=A0ABQ8UWL0_9EUKA|nr:hypothetical protein PAPYR_196 [Paratrimastix pyriformis]
MLPHDSLDVRPALPDHPRPSPPTFPRCLTIPPPPPGCGPQQDSHVESTADGPLRTESVDGTVPEGDEDEPEGEGEGPDEEQEELLLQEEAAQREADAALVQQLLEPREERVQLCWVQFKVPTDTNYDDLCRPLTPEPVITSTAAPSEGEGPSSPHGDGAPAAPAAEPVAMAVPQVELTPRRAATSRIVPKKPQAPSLVIPASTPSAENPSATPGATGSSLGPGASSVSTLSGSRPAGPSVSVSALLGQANPRDPPEASDVRIGCTLFVSCAQPDVDTYVFYALNESSIVYDGRLVVDEAWTSNDPLVLGCGTVAKLSRRVRGTGRGGPTSIHASTPFPPPLQHMPCRFPYTLDHFNGREAGSLLGQYILDHVVEVMSRPLPATQALMAQLKLQQPAPAGGLLAARGCSSTGPSCPSRPRPGHRKDRRRAHHGIIAGLLAQVGTPPHPATHGAAHSTCGCTGLVGPAPPRPAPPRPAPPRPAPLTLVLLPRGGAPCSVVQSAGPGDESEGHRTRLRINLHQEVALLAYAGRELVEMPNLHCLGWATALFHDRFGDFLEAARDAVLQAPEHEPMAASQQAWVGDAVTRFNAQLRQLLADRQATHNQAMGQYQQYVNSTLQRLAQQQTLAAMAPPTRTLVPLTLAQHSALVRRMPNRSRRDLQVRLVQWLQANKGQLPGYLHVALPEDDLDEEGPSSAGSPGLPSPSSPPA